MTAIQTIQYSELTEVTAIASGGFGVIHRAKHPQWGTVVYKELNSSVIPDGSKAAIELDNEAKSHILNHDNVVKLYGIVFEPRHYGVVLEYVPHGDLDEFVFRNKPVGWSEKLFLAHGVVCGMEYLHSIQPDPVIHGDLKTQNVLVGDNLVAKICDFGLAKWKAYSKTRTASRSKRKGTVTHMPPEIWNDINQPRTLKYDVYGFAILFWELITENEPFKNAQHSLIKEAVKSGQRPDLNAITGPETLVEHIKDCIARCWDQSPDSRPSFADLNLRFIKIREISGENVRGKLQPGGLGQNLQANDVTTFVNVPVSPTPAAIYEHLSYYKMDSEPRGLCLIFNIANFDKGAFPLEPRPGADKDTETLEQLFKELKFDVEVFRDVTMHCIELALLSFSCRDHSNFDAFVCCFLTHGKLGVLFTSDAKPIRILDIVEYFDDLHCESLRGKPKMFFIQACLTGVQSYCPSSVSAITSKSSAYNSSQGAANEVSPPRHATMQSKEHAEESSPMPAVTDGVLQNDWNTSCVSPTLEPAHFTTWVEGRATLVPSRPDFLISYSTLPGASAYRDREVGSLYVIELASCLRQRLEIDRALKLVSRGVSEELRKRDVEDRMSRFQLPFHLTSGMNKLIML